MWPLPIYVCPACGRTADARDFDRVECAGAASDGTAHPPVMMDETRAFREEEVRALWDETRRMLDLLDSTAARVPPDLELDSHHGDHVAFAHAVHAFPAPEEWLR